MNSQTTRYPKRQSGLRVGPEQEAVIKMYADRVGEKIGRLVSEIIVDSLTLLWAEKPISQNAIVQEQQVDQKQSVFREQPFPDKLLKAADIAKRLDISRSKAYQLMLRGEIPTVHINSAVRVRPQDLEDFILRSKE